MTLRTCLALAVATAISTPLFGQTLTANGLDQATMEGRIEGEKVVYRLANHDSRAITAWGVRLSQWILAEPLFTLEMVGDGWAELASFDGPDRSPGVRDAGMIFPGQIIEGSFNLAHGAAGTVGDRFELSVTALIYDDVSSSGSKEIIDGIFAERRAEWRERARWGAELQSARSAEDLRPWGPKIAAAPSITQNVSPQERDKQRRVRATLAGQIEQFTKTDNNRGVTVYLKWLKKKEELAARHAGVGRVQ